MSKDYKVNHHLKTWPEHFYQIIEGNKTFEARFNDRGFQVGDILNLKEWMPERGIYTGREQKVQVVHMIFSGHFGIEKGYCIMSIHLLN